MSVKQPGKVIITPSGEMKFYERPVEQPSSGVHIRQGPAGVRIRSHSLTAKKPVKAGDLKP